jgi:NADH-quinone oxidoreductase subunit C/D
MFNWKEFQKTKIVLSQDHSYMDHVGQHHLTIRPVDLLRWVEVASEDLGFFTLVEIAGVDLTEMVENDYQFELTYHLLNMGSHQRLNIHVRFNEQELIPSITALFSNADWMEREQKELLGVVFDRQIYPLFFSKDEKSFPLRKRPLKTFSLLDVPEVPPRPRINPNKSEQPYAEESYVWKNYGLLSPFSLGLFEWMVCYDPEKVVKSKANIGFYHQGLEKLLETKDLQQALQLADKINLGGAPTYGFAWAKLVEDFFRIKIPERAQAIRIVALEFARIAEHLTVMYDIAVTLKLQEAKLFINLREKVYELIEKYCGRRQGIGIIRFGGVKEDLPHGWIVEYQSVCELISKNLVLIHRSLLGQKLFRETLSVAEVSAQNALQWGIGGPAMRACGLNFDLRKSQPFYFYQDIDFDIPIGINGTSYERYLIRFEEIFQSFRIITQVIDNLPLGEFMNLDFDKGYIDIANTLKSLDFHQGWQYTGLESPNGECGFMAFFKDAVNPYRVKIKTPSFQLTQALPLFVQFAREDQIKTCLASLGLRQSEIDR